MKIFSKIACIYDNRKKAIDLYNKLNKKYKFIDIYKDPDVDCIIVLGGDGFLLHTMHKFMSHNIPLYGINTGTIGFLMNKLNEKEDLLEKISHAKSTNINPLEMIAINNNDEEIKALAINEVYLFRQTNQAAKLKVSINDSIQLNRLICDGIMVASPAGSSAYNFSAGGPIIPIGSNILALTAISAFRPRKWHGALLQDNVQVNLEVLEPKKRPVSAVADFYEYRNVKNVKIHQKKNIKITLLFDKGHSLEERIIKEQFDY